MNTNIIQKIETIIIKNLRQYLEENAAIYNDFKQKVIRFMDQFSIIERELYEPLSLEKIGGVYNDGGAT